MNSGSNRARSFADRIRVAAADAGVDPQRLRRRLVFQRVLSRLADRDGWVLKGGFCLETRLGLTSRATKDLDLVTRQGWGNAGALDLQDELDGLLDAPGFDDGFRFQVGAPRGVQIRGDREVWRVPVEALVGGTVFAQVRLDVVVQFAELEGGLESLVVRPPISGVGLSDVSVLAVDVNQHAAEKIHAYSRVYAEDRPSSRVKDLVDLVLLLEAGVLDLSRLHQRLVVVHRERDRSAPPGALPSPPGSWDRDYVAMLDEHELDVDTRTSSAAYALLSETYLMAMSTPLDEGTHT